jgi:hypothetical protein
VSAGYSGTPLARKLGCNPGGRLLMWQAPAAFAVADLPDGCTRGELVCGQRAGKPGEVVVGFFLSRARLAETVAGLGEAIFPAGALWIAWPRRAAGHESDIREQDVRDLALPLGLVDVKVAALGEDWSGLRLLWRTERRGG